jgi:spore coat polysaccharide biosynthesis protein SpsF
MSIVCIIQARMGSTRLPAKALADIGGMSMLARVVRRAGRARALDLVAVATTTEPVDAAIVAECERLAVPVTRGSQDDVLDRYYQAARAHAAELVVRITSDCPLIDPQVIDEVVGAFLAARPDYASNVVERRYPRGLDVEVFSFAALERAWREAGEEYQRAHVTPFLYQRPDLFRVLSVPGGADHGGHRWTVDTPEDLAFARAIYARFANDDGFGWGEALELVEREPALAAINAHVEQKELRQG